MDTKTRTVSLVVGTILVLDQVTKALVARTLGLYESVPVIDSFFHLTRVHTTGAAFGVLAQGPAWFRQPFCLIATGVAVLALFLLLRHSEKARRPGILGRAAVLAG